MPTLQRDRTEAGPIPISPKGQPGEEIDKIFFSPSRTSFQPLQCDLFNFNSALMPKLFSASSRCEAVSPRVEVSVIGCALTLAMPMPGMSVSVMSPRPAGQRDSGRCLMHDCFTRLRYRHPLSFCWGIQDPNKNNYIHFFISTSAASMIWRINERNLLLSSLEQWHTTSKRSRGGQEPLRERNEYKRSAGRVNGEIIIEWGIAYGGERTLKGVIGWQGNGCWKAKWSGSNVPGVTR